MRNGKSFISKKRKEAQKALEIFLQDKSNCF